MHRSAIALLLSVSLCPLPARADTPPQTAKKPTPETYHGQQVPDDYRWLEDGNNPAVREWIAAQNRHTRGHLEKDPARPAIQQRMRELVTSVPTRYFDVQARAPAAGGARLFARKFQPPREQPTLVLLPSADDTRGERVLLDPLAIAKDGTTIIDWYVPSLDGELLAVSLSEKGTEDGTVHVYEVKTGKELPDVIPHVNGGTAGGSLAWAAGSKGFYYTRYPSPGERPKEDLGFYQQVYYHALGTPLASDRYAVGKEFPRIAEVALSSSEDGRYILANVANGDGGEHAHYLLGEGGGWQPVSQFVDQITNAEIGRDGFLYLLSRKDAPRGKLLRAPLSQPALAHAQLVVPESEAVIEGALPLRSRLYVLDLSGGVNQVRIFDAKAPSKAPRLLPLKPVSSVTGIAALKDDEILFSNQSFTEPPAWYHFRGTGEARRTALFVRPPVNFADIEVLRETATSKDGTKVPVTVLLKKGLRRDGQNPTILTGYGGYGISLTPSFQLSTRLWLEQGGVFAIANLRGGGEFGEAWHKAGMLTKKQNVFDDFIACAEHLIAMKLTSPKRLGIQGGSNGGLLMGAVTTQRPELFRAVVSFVGIYDMVRSDRSPNGAFNVTEFGTSRDPEQFRALYAYSPYHRVKDGAAYPAVLLVTGENDPRVQPSDSRKMAARLQAATSSGLPVLLSSRSKSGHGATNLSDGIEKGADAYTFFFQQLGVPYKPIK